MKVVIFQFPGSHGAEDVALAYRDALGVESEIVWHEREMIPEGNLYVVPGGASFADLLRPGAMAKTSPAAGKLRRLAREKRLLGIGNGFHILCELEILLGAFLINDGLKFIRRDVHIQVDENSCKLIQGLEVKRKMLAPVATSHARYYADFRTLQEIEDKKLAVFRYTDEFGARVDGKAFAGSLNSIAGLTNFGGNVLGLMFHPERATSDRHGSTDGLPILRAALGV